MFCRPVGQPPLVVLVFSTWKNLLELFILDGHGLSGRSQIGFGLEWGNRAMRTIWAYSTLREGLLGDVNIASFWNAPWADALRPKDNHPLNLYTLSK
jgi:hypothetical protein